jgi:hypothetical protein
VEAFMANTLKLPVGIDDFRKLRESHFYYVDKTRLIEQLLLNWSEVTLFTRPRRFGKTLNMSMLKSFFDIGTDKALFDGLYISGNKELCDEYMGKYPVIFLSLKGVEGLTYEEAFEAFVRIMGKEVNRVSFLADSDKLTQIEREQYKGLTIIKNNIPRAVDIRPAEVISVIPLLYLVKMRIHSIIRQQLSFDMRRHPVSTANCKNSLVFSACPKRPLISETISL